MYKEDDDDQQRGNAWESAVRKTQHQLQQHQSGRRRGCLFAPMSVAPDDDEADADAAEPSTPGEDVAAAVQQQQQQEVVEERRSTEICHVERLLSTGDFYTGQWRCGAPHGIGKYLWTDGCMYEGEWRQGRTMGNGKFSWPSGATYEGEFNSGFMHGFGTYTGSSGDTYRGLWSMNLKHGRGKKSYANGDHYDGDWLSGLQNGHGRYTWKNGNEYVGQWRNGVIHGRGSLVWANGNRYDGAWEDGLPKGNGSFRWADGSLYIGVWSADPAAGTVDEQQKKGVYYPSPVATSPTARDPHEAFAAGIRACTICPGETVSILPSQKTLNWSGGNEADPLQMPPSKGPDSATGGGDVRPRRRSVDTAFVRPPRKANARTNTIAGLHNGSAGGDRSFNRICIWDSNGDITCDIVDNSAVLIPGEGREGNGDAIPGVQSEEVPEPATARSPMHVGWTTPKATKKQGQAISKGHKNYDLMLNLQLGIRHAVGKQQNVGGSSLDLKASAFDPREKVWTKFPPEGSKHTPPHQSCDFKWKDYCPLVFKTLRRLFKVDAGEYMLSLCGNDALRELSSPGKSGSFFYLTNDDKYMIKTMKKSEVKVLLRMLPAYYNHVRAFENTLVTKFFGLHCVRMTGATQKKVRFVIIGNLFCSEYPIHRRFDLKGSSHGRTTDKPETEIDEYTTLKDLDLNFIFRLQRSWFQEFCRQVDRDCEFLEQERIMDYSLLVGLHFRDVSLPSDIPKDDGDADRSREATPRLSRVDMDQFLCDPSRWATIRLGVNMPARVEQTIRRSDCDSPLIGEPTGEFHEVILFFGIIDILQDYDISKKLEHAYKSIQYDPTSISAVDPKQYSKRFRDFIFRIFTEDT